MKLEDTSWDYPIGAVVTWSDGPPAAQPYTIAARRLTEGQGSQFYEYLLVPKSYADGAAVWAYEPDVSLVREEAPC